MRDAGASVLIEVVSILRESPHPELINMGLSLWRHRLPYLFDAPEPFLIPHAEIRHFLAIARKLNA